ncbi:BtrH N-terminal domain-containing protein [Catenuloplanes japonicus]|uniref:BtrH N-terminal domain-containing protein n=1 Tax=Catenuloplanes japonicus TaxID=33876 RepID=UPI000526377C|nr:BtrH N-terminal domain-containing protein [Catenuloplanes japonicus]
MIVENVSFAGGLHCETTTLGALLRHAGVELSEPMMFGLGEGLGFIYWDAKNMEFPFLGGRSKPATITRTVAERLGLTLDVRETSSPRKAWQNVADALDAGRPAGLQLDSYHLEYFTEKVHFGGHFVAIYGYDDKDAYLVDTAQQGGAVTTSLAGLAQARHARGPMTARNLSYTVSRVGDVDLGAAAVAAIRGNARTFLHPPIANLGHRGIATAARRVRNRPANPRAAMLMERGGTGGALFRNLYRDFLAECVVLVDDEHLREGHRRYAEIAPLWTEVAGHLATGDSANASALLTDLAAREHDAMRTLAAIR